MHSSNTINHNQIHVSSSLSDAYTESKKVNLVKKGMKVSLMYGLLACIAGLVAVAVGAQYLPPTGIPSVLLTARLINNVLIANGLLGSVQLYLINYVVVMSIHISLGVLTYTLLYGLVIHVCTGVKVRFKLKRMKLRVGSAFYFPIYQYKKIVLVSITASVMLFLSMALIMPRTWFWMVFYSFIGILTSFIADDVFKLNAVRNLPPSTVIQDDGLTLTVYTNANNDHHVINNMLLRRVAIVAALVLTITATAAVGIMVRNLVAALGHQSPPWDVAAFRNEAHAFTYYTPDIVSNGALMQEMRQFNDVHAADNNNFFAWHVVYMPAVHDDAGQQKQDDFISAFVSGWEEDPASQVMPFNTAYIRHVLEPMIIYFATEMPANITAPWAGFVLGNRLVNTNHMFIQLVDLLPDVWGVTHQAETSIHEVGHALGLSTLTVLFVNEFTPDFSNSCAWYYDIHFDVVLLEKAGPEAFWRAAFTSNEAYGALWDSYLGNYISFEDIMLARGVRRRIGPTSRAFIGLGITTGSNPRILQAYRDYTGNVYHDLFFFADLAPRFMQAFGANGQDAVPDAELMSTLHDMASIGRAHRVSPAVAVLDNNIYGTYIWMLYAVGLLLAVVAAGLSLFVLRRQCTSR